MHNCKLIQGHPMIFKKHENATEYNSTVIQPQNHLLTGNETFPTAMKSNSSHTLMSDSRLYKHSQC